MGKTVDVLRKHGLPIATRTLEAVAKGQHPLSAGIRAVTGHASEYAGVTVHDAVHQGTKHRGRQFLAAASGAIAALAVEHLGEAVHDRVTRGRRTPPSES